MRVTLRQVQRAHWTEPFRWARFALRPLFLALACLAAALLWSPFAAYAYRAEAAQLEQLLLDRPPPELTIDISARDLAATLGVPGAATTLAVALLRWPGVAATPPIAVSPS